MGTSTRVLTSLAAGGVLVYLSCGTAFATWNESLAGGSNAFAHSTSAPTTPSAPAPTCTSSTGATITVAFTPVPNATSYTIYQAAGSSTGVYTPVATGVTSSPYTTGALLVGTYYFEIRAVEGSGWATSNSAASVGRTIGLASCT